MDTIEKIFEKHGWFPVIGKIDSKLRTELEQYVIARDETTLKFIFRTGGGDLEETLRMIDMINLWKELSQGQVRSFCIGACCSAGMTLLSACDQELRECSPYASFLFHSAKVLPASLHNFTLEENIAALRKHWQWSEFGVEQEMKGFNLSREKLTELRVAGENHACYLSAPEAVSLGIIKKIVVCPEL